MKKLILILPIVSLLSGGCKAMDSLIFHPLHVVYEQHEYNEEHKAQKP